MDAVTFVETTLILKQNRFNTPRKFFTDLSLVTLWNYSQHAHLPVFFVSSRIFLKNKFNFCIFKNLKLKLLYWIFASFALFIYLFTYSFIYLFMFLFIYFIWHMSVFSNFFGYNFSVIISKSYFSFINT